MVESIVVEPMDQYNKELVDHTHPADWVNPEPDGRYNLVVIGAGTAGLVTAAGAAGLGAKVALIERHMLGGDCLNVGCVPSKALIRAARAVHEVLQAGQFGVEVPEGVKVNFAAVMERMRRLRAGISPNDSAKRFRDLGVDVYIGEARFSGTDRVEVDGKSLRYARAVIATGARAAALPIEGLAEAGYLTNETVFSLTELPRRLGVIGAGPIGCELAQAFARFGSEVTLIESEHGILPREDPEASAIVKQSLMNDGVKILCCGRNLKVAKDAKGKHLTVDSHDGHYDVLVDEILVGVGRTPNVEGLELETVGVDYNKRGVTVNDHLRTTNKRIYAAGDICSNYKFTHTADAMARIVIQNALFFGRSKVSALTIPWCTYTDPEIAHVGMYPEEAEKKGITVKTFTVELSKMDRAILDGQEEGFLRVHVKQGSDKIIGATLVASHAGEMISELTVAMVAGVGLGGISKTIHPYPTVAEVIKRAGDAYNRTRLTKRTAKLMRRFLAWRR